MGTLPRVSDDQTPTDESAPTKGTASTHDMTPFSTVQDLLDVLDLTEVGQAEISAELTGTDVDLVGQSKADIFTGRSQPTPHGRVFGGQVLAQCIIAGGRTVPEVHEGKPRHIHSLHGYFLRPGDSKQPLSFAVERLRDGGSFSARRVHALQNGAPIMSMLMSFQEEADGIDHQWPMPDVTAPEDLPTTADIVGDIDHPIAQHWAHGRAIDVRHVEGALYFQPAEERVPYQNLWMKTQSDVPADPLLNAAILAYASDYTLLESAMRANGVAWATKGFRAASLDHAMWFHRPVQTDDWILYSQESPSASGGRGLGLGRMFTRDGTLVATVAQEGMMRIKDLSVLG